MSSNPQVATETGWHAELRCRFAYDVGKTRLVERSHKGPLLVQRPFWPEPGGTCHLYLIHPPGGIAGGDRLTLDVDVDAGARALLTTPAATKIYRAAGREAAQTSLLRVATGGQLEWLPQETILFDGAEASLTTRVALAGDAQFMGWEILALGRTASTESFTQGHLAQRFEITRDGRPLWLERATYEAGDAVLAEPWGLDGSPVTGTFVTTLPEGVDRRALVKLAREAANPTLSGSFSATAVAQALICRYTGPWAEPARQQFAAVWSALRPHILGRVACAPRIWST